ncbi:MAG: kynureninase [Pseudomonadales bacterium]
MNRDWLAEALRLDETDPLRASREAFHLNEGEVYLDGNSLGALPRVVADELNTAVAQQWGQRQIRSWNEGWIELPQRTGDQIAPLLGANAGEVICADSVSVNLFKLATASLWANPERTTIVSVKDMFPTDLYIAQGIAGLLGEAKCQLKLINIDELDQLDNQTNLVILSQVNFRSGEAYDVGKLTRVIHEAGAKVVWDVSHSAGVLPINVKQHEVDFVVGCGYKFLNGGPGAPAFMYVRPELLETLQQPLSGWMGHSDPFAFETQYRPAQGRDRLLAGTPNILSLTALHSALTLYQDLDLRDVFSKAQQLASWFVEILDSHPALKECQALKPPARGAQVSFQHDHAFAITQVLIERGIICDFREPNLARFGFAPLYVSFTDVTQAALTLAEVLVDGSYLQKQYQISQKVT